MDRLIPIINRLQDVWSCLGAPPIELPQLVVVGSQSSGKSSVLENIVGRDFLPRGSGIVTRRPLILQLVNTRPNNESELFPTDEADPNGDERPSRRPNDTDTESVNGAPTDASKSLGSTGHHSHHPSGDANAGGAGAGARRMRTDFKKDDKSQKDKKDDTQMGGSKPSGRYASDAMGAVAATGSASTTSSLSASGTLLGGGSVLVGAAGSSSNAAGSAGASGTSGAASGAGADTESNNGDGEMAEWGEFGHKKGVRFYDFDEIRDEITRETDRIVGSKKNISPSPITLKVYSPKVLNLTLVDLPGITKVPVGDQPTDIEKQIRDMIWSYISSPASIIVAVSPANADLANSDSLKLAREADPQGVRTIGVLTKIDLMDKGTDALDVLMGKVIPLQHGFVGVINRSQQDINQRKSIQSALSAERQFFVQHAVYRPIANRCGTSYLARRLNMILMHHIQESLPDMRVRVAHNIAETQEELESYGNPLLNSPINLGPLLLHLLSKFCNNYCDALEGKSPDVSITQLYGGARISYIFHDVFCKRLDNINPFDELTDQDIRTAIRNATGPRPSLFIPEISFELLVKRQIERLQQPSLQTVDLVFDELKRVASQCESLVVELQRFPVLRESVYDCVRALLERRLKPTKTMINNLVHVELAYINTNHPDFIGGSKAVSSLMDRMAAMSAQAKAGAMGGTGQAPAGASASPPAGKPVTKDDGFKSPGSKSQASPRVESAANPGPLRLIGRDDSKFSSSGSNSARKSMDDSKSLVPIRSNNANGGSAAADDFYEQPPQQQLPPKPQKRLRDLHLEDPKPTPAPGLHRPIQSIPTPLPTDRELIETEIIKSLISSYFNIVRKNIQDSVPKAIMYFLVNHSKQDIQSELVRTLYKETHFEGLLKEADDVSLKRSQCIEHLRTMRKALDIVNSVRDYNPLSGV